MKLGYLGPNTNSENVAQKYATNIAGLKIQSYPCMDYVFKAIKYQKVDKIIVPIKNSITGDIRYKKEVERIGLNKIDELSIRIVHYLAAKTKGLKFIASHQEVLNQCDNYLNARYPNLSRIGVESTNEAAKIASFTHGMAAIASLETCLKHNLKIIGGDLVKDNYSTFWVLENGN